MGFFNSLTVRIPLAILGGTFYGLLTYALVRTLDGPEGVGVTTGLLVFFLYLGSRLLLLFSGVETAYYSKTGNVKVLETTPFHQTAQWVGKLYHYHDWVFFLFLTLIALGFLLSLVWDGKDGRPLGQTFFDVFHHLMNEF